MFQEIDIRTFIDKFAKILIEYTKFEINRANETSDENEQYYLSDEEDFCKNLKIGIKKSCKEADIGVFDLYKSFLISQQAIYYYIVENTPTV